MSERDKKKLGNRLQQLYDGLYQINDERGLNIADTFHRLPLRTGTDYYKIVLNPLSLHAVGRKIKKLQYDSAQQFVDDLSLVGWNARLYNRKDSRFYTHALVLKNYVLSVVLPKLKSDKVVTGAKQLSYPFLGDLPDGKDEPVLEENINYDYNGPTTGDEYASDITPGPAPAQVPVQAPLQYQSDFTPLKFQLHNPEKNHKPPQQQLIYNKPKSHKSTKHAESGIRRGRPPIIDKPFETRIKLILKNFKKLRDPNNESRSLTQHFEKLPDIKIYPDYYNKVQFPISLNEIKIKVRTRKYTNVEQFIHDLDVMFSNAQVYYEIDPYSEEYIDFINFNKEAQVIIQIELNKSDRELIGQTTSGSDGIIRYPLDSLTVNGHLYKIGDWVLIANPSDPDTPTVGQIFRLWLTEDGNRYTNVCWYYRPEQTCHKEDRLFFKNEVCKTGQYRDHLVEEIVGPTYVVFLTRYQKGDLPESITGDSQPWFICEFRYNETTHVFNRIRTWKACLPDEVRDNFELPFAPLNEPRKLIKYESPIRGLLSKNAYLGMKIPEATEGSQPNSPPLVGSCYISPPFPEDDLGQYISSPHVVAVPDHDDHNAGRRAYLFTPISQLKGGGSGGIHNHNNSHNNNHNSYSAPLVSSVIDIPTVNSTLSGMPAALAGLAGQGQHQGQLSQIGGQIPSSNHGFGSDPFLPNYRSLQTQIQETQQKKMQEQELLALQQQQHQQLFRRETTAIVPQGMNNYHKSASYYATLLAGGVLAYGVVVGTELAVNKRRRLVEEDGSVEEAIFYRAPPVLVEKKVVGDVGHSAKYLRWKNEQA